MTGGKKEIIVGSEGSAIADASFSAGASYLSFTNSPSEYCAVDLSLVERIERVYPDEIERVGSSRVIKRDGTAIPVYSLCEATSVAELPDASEYAVIFSRAGGKRFGVLGLPPIDSITTRAVTDSALASVGGIAGSFVHEDRTFLVIDLRQVALALKKEPESLEGAKYQSGTARHSRG